MKPEFEELLHALNDGKATARETREALRAAGMEEECANEMVFITIGGGDIISENERGRYYEDSGLTVEEVTHRWNQ